MPRALLIVFLLLAPAWAKDKTDYPLAAHLSLGRGQFIGSYVWEIRINRMIYISPDPCRDAQSGEWYRARLEKHTIHLLVGTHSCRLRVTDKRPYLVRGSSVATRPARHSLVTLVI